MTSRPENSLKDLGNTPLVNDCLDVLVFEAPEQLRQSGLTVINLFAGNCNESVVFYRKLVDKIPNLTIIAVDAEPPHINLIEEMRGSSDKKKPVFILSDAFDYLSHTTIQADILTAYGAEFLFNEHSSSEEVKRNTELFIAGVLRVVKVGGFIHVPMIAENFFKNDSRFQEMIQGLYRRIDASSISSRSSI